MSLELFVEQVDVAPSKYFGDETSAFDEQASCNIESCHYKLVLNILIEVVVAQNVRGPITDDQVNWLALEYFVDLLYCLLACDVPLDGSGTFDLCYLEKVH